MQFQQVRDFLESWGLGFETPCGDSSTIPYPAVYARMQDDALKVGGKQLSKFISSITDTIESQTYLEYTDWDEIEIEWDNRPTV